MKQLIDSIFEVLGKPPNYLAHKISPLWDDRYRVNIYVQEHGGNSEFVKQIRISDSFFVRATTEGKIIQISPHLERKYGTNRTDSVGNGNFSPSGLYSGAGTVGSI